jgi:Predicted flavoprotein
MKKLQVVGLGGSLSEQSTSLAALSIALEGAAEAGADVTLFDVKVLDLPMYVPGSTAADAPAAARRLADAVGDADGLLWSSPMYHGTLSGAFKNALDWLQLLSDREPAYLTDKVIGLISTAGGTQGLQAVNTMEYVVRALRGWAVPLVVPVAQSWQTFGEDGRVLDSKAEAQLRALGREVVRAARQFAPNPPTTPDAQRAEEAIAGYPA